MLELKRDGNDDWTHCFTYPKAIDFPVHTFFSSGGNQRNRRAVYINSVKFYDNEEEIGDEQE